MFFMCNMKDLAHFCFKCQNLSYKCKKFVTSANRKARFSKVFTSYENLITTFMQMAL